MPVLKQYNAETEQWEPVVVGAQGPQGPQGVQGIQGETGPAGADGSDGADGADGQGIATGGTSGQVLAKASGTDYDTEWVDQSGGITTGKAIAMSLVFGG